MAVQDNTGMQLFCVSAKFDLNTDTLKLCIMACLTHQQGGGREVVSAEVVFEAVIGNRIATLEVQVEKHVHSCRNSR